MAALDFIKEDILFIPNTSNRSFSEGYHRKAQFAGKIRLVYKNKEVLVLPYFFRVAAFRKPYALYYDEDVNEDAPVYRKIKGCYYYFYFNDLGSPMFQEYFLSFEEDRVSSDVNLPHSWYKAYRAHNFVLSFLDYRSLHYAFYKEGYARMEQIAQNIDNDLPYFHNISDINLEIAGIFSEEEMPALYENSKTINDKYFTQFCTYMDKLPYAVGLEEWKNLLLKYFGESNLIGFTGLNENYFKDFTYRTELLFFTFWLHNCSYIFDSEHLSEEQRKYYSYFFFDKNYLDNYKIPAGCCTFRVGGNLDHVWLGFIRKLFWRRLKVIAKF